MNSLDNISIPNWRWANFLEKTQAAFSKYNLFPCSIEDHFLNKKVFIGSKKNKTQVQVSTWAFHSTKIRNARAACVQSGDDISVLNLLISPDYKYDLPFFGVDFVTLKNGHLIAIDLQPVLKNDFVHTQHVWDQLIPIHSKWQSLIPVGGAIPEEAKPYFSPGFLWSRIPLNAEGNQIIDKTIYHAFNNYLMLYIDLLDKAEKVSDTRSKNLLDGQKSYMDYRANKDPARGLLTSLFGKEWTEEYINGVLFNLK